MILGLDCSLKTGYAVMEGHSLIDYGLLLAKRNKKQDHPNYPINFIEAADNIATQLDNVLMKFPIKTVIIEETNQMARDRYAQKQLEFIHYAINKLMAQKTLERVYLSTSQWKKLLNIKLSKEQREHNKLVKSGKAKGKITNKHLTVAAMNEAYGLGLLLKDNDIADAIAIASAYLIQNK